MHYTMFDDCPIVGAVKSSEDLKACLKSPVKVVFVLYGDILNIKGITQEIIDNDKIPFVHIDLIEGLSQKEVSLEFIKNETMAKGIISTKAQMIKKAKELNLIAVQRFFILDSLALENTTKLIKDSKADFIEVLPALIPKVIQRLTSISNKGIIAGGLVSEKSEVTMCLSAGATAVSSSNKTVWYV